MGTLKFVNLDYKQQDLIQESIVLLGLCLLESIRIHLGKRGSLSDHGKRSLYEKTFRNLKSRFVLGYHVWLSVILTIPVSLGVIYLLFLQTHVLKLEYILCALMLLLILLEMI